MGKGLGDYGICSDEVSQPVNQFCILDEVSQPVKQLYKVIKRHTGKVGGYGHNCSIYGEVTTGSFHKIIKFLKLNLGFDHNSIFLDIGSGLGKPNFHVLLDPGVKYSFGVELESLRYALSLHNLSHVHEVPELSYLTKNPNIYFSHVDVTKLETFNPITHVYTFDVGMPPDTMIGMSKAMHNSTSVRAFVSFHKPKEIIEDYEFPVELIGHVSTSMHGSSEGHKCYIYRHKRYKDIHTFSQDKMLLERDGNVAKVLEDLNNLTFNSTRSSRRTRGKNNDKENGKENPVSLNKMTKKKLRKKRSKTTHHVETNSEVEVDSKNDSVFKKGFSILKTKDKYSKWIQNELNVYFPKERPKRACNLKKMR